MGLCLNIVSIGRQGSATNIYQQKGSGPKKFGNCCSTTLERAQSCSK